MGAIAFLGSSCKKNQDTVASADVNLAAVNDAGTFGQGSRAYIDYFDGNKMKWSAGDQLMIYNLDNDWTKSKREVFTLQTGEGTTSGKFVGNNLGDALGIGFRVFYPASKVVNHELGKNNSQTFDVPATQNYAKDCMDPTSLVMACTTGAVHSNFQMQHIFGFANIRIADLRTGGPKKVKSVEVTDNFFNLNGNITADLPGVESEVLSGLINQCAAANTDAAFNAYMTALTSYLHEINYTSEPGTKTITLNCPTDGVQLSNTEYTNFVITLRPGSLSKGFDVKINFTDETAVEFHGFNPNYPTAYVNWVGTTITPNLFCTMPGNILNFNVILQ